MARKIEGGPSSSESQAELTEREKNVFDVMKQISDFAKEKSNGWIHIKGTDAPNVGLVETKTAYSGGRDSGPTITMSAGANLEEISKFFDLSYIEESDEDGVAGEHVEIKDRDQLAAAIEEHKDVTASLKE